MVIITDTFMLKNTVYHKETLSCLVTNRAWYLISRRWCQKLTSILKDNLNLKSNQRQTCLFRLNDLDQNNEHP